MSPQQENTILIKTTRDLVEKQYDAGQTSMVQLDGVYKDLAIAGGSFILAPKAFDYYTGKNNDQTQGEPHGTKH